MRPVNKGTDDRAFNPYSDAQGELINTIDEYCSYCERWLSSSAHVEHKLPKSHYPELEFSWVNFLLSCSNCNSYKGHREITLDECIWPDSDNTMRAFSYRVQGVVLPMTGYGDDIDKRIQRTWELLGLNRHPYVQAHSSIKNHQIKTKDGYIDIRYGSRQYASKTS